MVSGSIWIAVIFENNDRVQEEIILKQSSSFEIKSSFTGSDIGFYKYTCLNLIERNFCSNFRSCDNVVEE